MMIIKMIKYLKNGKFENTIQKIPIIRLKSKQYKKKDCHIQHT